METIQWISNSEKPELGGEKLVVWNLNDGDYPTVTSMDWDAKKQEWTDPRGTGDPVPDSEILYWAEQPQAPKGIERKIWDVCEGAKCKIQGCLVCK